MLLLLTVLTVQANWLNPADQARRLEIVAEVNSGHTSWRAGVNPRFEGTSYSYLKSLCGSLEDAGQTRLPIQESVTVAAPPAAFDSRTQWGAMCASTKEVRDQSNCGSCWAFGAAEASTDRLCIQTSGTKIYHLGAEDVLSCCKTCGAGCNGGYPSEAWAWFRSTGVVTGGNYKDYNWCWAYELPTCDHHTTGQQVPCTSLPTYPTPPCTLACDKSANYSTSYTTDKRKSLSAYGVSSAVSAIQTEIMTNGPVEGSFSVYQDFESYISGVYVHKTGSYVGGHSIKIIGWGTDTGQDYWTVANSWNTDWGEAGFFRILRGVNECGIEGSIVAGMWA